MRFAIATFHVPHPDGAAAGRQLWALTQALLADGHELVGWCWGPRRSVLPPPDWCEHRPFEPSDPRHRALNLLFPRADVGRVPWPVPDDCVVWADDWSSSPIAEQSGCRSLLTVHYDVRLDAKALGQRSLPLVQDWRAQHRAVRRSSCVVALSQRVADAAGVATVVAATVPMPAAALPLVEEPKALLLADWTWPPNLVSLRVLLDVWPAVRARVAGAQLLVAGRGGDVVGSGDGVRVLGEVPRAVDAMSEAAVLAFPCPPTSGPKMKVLDAVVSGLPVVTTAAGVEGLQVPAGSVATATIGTFADALVDVLGDPQRRAAMARGARESAVRHHDPAQAARQRVAALRRNIGPDRE